MTLKTSGQTNHLIVSSGENITTHEDSTEWMPSQTFTYQTVTGTQLRTDGNFANITESDEMISDFNITLRKTQNVFLKETFEQFQNIIWFGLAPSLTVIGIAGNICGLWFVMCGKLREPFHLFLLALMAVDLLYLIIVLISNSLVVLERYNKSFADYLNCHMSANLNALQSMAYSVCAHLITAMSFERLINIKSPLDIQSFCLHRYTTIAIVIIFAVDVGLMVPGFLILEPKDTTDPTTNITTCKPVPTSWAKNPVSKYFVMSVLIVARFVPCVVTFAANILISVLLARRRSQRAAMFANKATRGEHYEQFKITLTLIALSVALVLSLIPSALATILFKYYPDLYGMGKSQYYIYLFIKDLGYFLRIASAANDFFMYVVLSKPSRSAFIDLFRSKCCFYSLNNTKHTETSDGSNRTIEGQESLDQD